MEDSKVIISIQEYNNLQDIKKESETNGFLYLKNENEYLKNKVKKLNERIFYMKQSYDQFTELLIDERRKAEEQVDELKKERVIYTKKVESILNKIKNSYILSLIFKSEISKL